MSPSFNRVLTIVPTMQLDDPVTSTLTYPKKLNLRITNSTGSMVAVSSREFTLGSALKGDPSRPAAGKDQFSVEFLVGKNDAGRDVYRAEVLLKPGEPARAWLALDKDTNDAVAHDALGKNQVGTWRLDCHWLADPLEYRQYVFSF
jgi:hypothetical protein